eukprot:2106231-Rhodomonas_salina.1
MCVFLFACCCVSFPLARALSSEQQEEQRGRPVVEPVRMGVLVRVPDTSSAKQYGRAPKRKTMYTHVLHCQGVTVGREEGGALRGEEPLHPRALPGRDHACRCVDAPHHDVTGNACVGRARARRCRTHSMSAK